VGETLEANLEVGMRHNATVQHKATARGDCTRRLPGSEERPNRRQTAEDGGEGMQLPGGHQNWLHPSSQPSGKTHYNSSHGVGDRNNKLWRQRSVVQR
jgi:hypothetical protein